MNIRCFPLSWIWLCILSALLFAEVDTFGITQMYPNRAGTRSWNSAHWNNGTARVVKYDSDQYDPTDWTDDHSGGTDGFSIDGNGTMTMSGSGPRFHINSLRAAKGAAQFFRDVEFTAYYKRRGSAGQNYGGMVVGVRSGPLGHASAGGNNCDATTYYARFRNDGKWDFEKELNHPGSTYWSGSGYNKQDPLWGGAKLPLNRWIGMKYVVYNVNSNSAVRLELYIDSTSGGNPVNGGIWEMAGTVTDSGAWPSGDVSGCDYAQNAVIVEGHGTLLMRTDGDTAVYKMVSVREIDPVSTGAHRGDGRQTHAGGVSVRPQAILVNGVRAGTGEFSNVTRYRYFSLLGSEVKRNTVPAGAARNGAASGACGIFIAVSRPVSGYR